MNSHVEAAVDLATSYASNLAEHARSGLEHVPHSMPAVRRSRRGDLSLLIVGVVVVVLVVVAARKSEHGGPQADFLAVDALAHGTVPPVEHATEHSSSSLP
jgi:hypothetical protein